MADVLPDTSNEALLLKGIAERHQPPLTLEEARDRLQRGGARYREMLDRGHQAISEALTKHFETVMDRDSYDANQEMAQKLKRHEVTPLMVRLANDYWHDRYNEASNAAWEVSDGGASLITAAHYARMSVYEYVWPGNQDEIIKFGFNWEPSTGSAGR
jgi:16S rRNA C1402 (ribose-2'-O) methylase RsmI